MLAGSAAVGQALLVLTAPIIARLFSPADFGINAGYAFVLMVLLAINSLRYEYSIPLPRDEAEASNLVGITLFLVVVLSLTFTIMVWSFADPLVAFLNEPRVKDLLPLLPFGLIIGGFIMALNYWLTRQKRFSVIGLSQIGSSVGQVTTQIMLGIAQFGALGLALGALAGQLIACIILAVRTLPLPNIQPRTWMPSALRYKNFPLFTMPASLVDLVGTNLPAVLFLAFFSATEAGYFAQTMRMMNLPLGIISNAVAQTFYPTLSEKRDDPVALHKFFGQTASILFIISLAGFGYILVAGDTLFAFALGERWLTSGLYAEMLAPFFLIAFVTSPLSALALVSNHQREGLWYSSLVTILRILALFLGKIAHSPELGIALFSIMGVLVYLLYFAWLMHLAGLRLSVWLWEQRLPIGIGVTLIALGFALRGSFSSPVYLILFGLLFGVFGLVFVQMKRARL